jgi:hypothetical protein
MSNNEADTIASAKKGINYTSQQRFRSMYENNRFECVTATLPQPHNLKIHHVN